MTILIEGLKSKRQVHAIGRFIRKVCAALPQLRKGGEISFLFISDREIRKLNRKFLRHDEVTDVIAFPYPWKPSRRENRPFGDIYISVDTARRAVEKGGYPLIQELSLYALHGMLHLIGYKDHSIQDRRRMVAAQKKIFTDIAPNLAPPDQREPRTSNRAPRGI